MLTIILAQMLASPPHATPHGRECHMSAVSCARLRELIEETEFIGYGVVPLNYFPSWGPAPLSNEPYGAYPTEKHNER